MESKYVEKLPWNNINDYLLKTGSVRDPEAFIDKSIQNISDLIPFEQARIFFFNTNGKINDYWQMGTKKDWTDVYLEYYSKLDNGKYSIGNLIKDYSKYYTDIDISVLDWTAQSEDEFLKDYIKPQGINYSAIFTIHAYDDFVKCVFALDRVSKRGYSKREQAIMKIILLHLENLFRNLHITLLKNNEKNIEKLDDILSVREREISRHICEGLNPDQISKKLFISISTVYRHIANIYQKLNVCSRQELIIKLYSFGIIPAN